jgi:phosphoribosylaminoimidazolecarboxamide formyltransferase/IMP cyclohydrolase
MLKAARALISVFDKRNIETFAEGLANQGIEILSTGGTFKTLQESGVPVSPVSEVTGFPEILGGRVKTLHPRIHGGILADREQASHLAQLREHGIAPIDLVVVNLYPFQATASDASKSYSQVVEMIDIGGPCMIRAAAKNHSSVVVVVDPDDYPQVLAALEDNEGQVPEALRRRLALKAFRHTQSYDAAIAGWLDEQNGDAESDFDSHLLIDAEKEFEPRYGENPHQSAAVYSVVSGAGIFGGYEQLQGKQMSYNNLLDADAGRRLVATLAGTSVAILKHNNPCGVGRGESVVEAYKKALECDPVSAFGSIVAVNEPVDGAAAEAMSSLFIEVVIAPEITDEAIEIFANKKNLRVIRSPLQEIDGAQVELRSIDGGFLAQTLDLAEDDSSTWTCPTKREPTAEEVEALDFNWRVVRHVKSNAIVVGNRFQTVGIGAGQMSRVDSCHLAISKSQVETAGCVAASDAFFPFPDGLEVLAQAGVTAVVQPGGSKRDAEVVEAADKLAVAMLFTGNRHFRH